jgi:hypothetical protein
MLNRECEEIFERKATCRLQSHEKSVHNNNSDWTEWSLPHTTITILYRTSYKKEPNIYPKKDTVEN